MKRIFCLLICIFSLNCMERRPSKKQKTEAQKIERIKKIFKDNITIIKNTPPTRFRKCRAVYDRLSEPLFQRVTQNKFLEVEYYVHTWIAACNEGQLDQAPPLDKALKKACDSKRSDMIALLLGLGAEFRSGFFNSPDLIVAVSGLSENFVSDQLIRHCTWSPWRFTLKDEYEKGLVKKTEILSYLWMALYQYIEWLDLEWEADKKIFEGDVIKCFNVCYSITKKSRFLLEFERQLQFTYDEECYRMLVSIYESQHDIKGPLQNNQRLASLHNLHFSFT